MTYRSTQSRISSYLSVFSLATLASCSLSNIDVNECKETSECREAFGVGSICADNGFCAEAQAQAQPRCEKTFPVNLFDNPEDASRRIIIGNIMDRSSTTHQARENSAQLAFAAINEQSGVGGREFGVVFCNIEENPEFDSLTRTEAAVASARYLADVVGVPAIIGPAASSDTQAVFSDLSQSEKNVLVISPSATSPTLSELDPSTVTDAAPGLLWRTAPPDSLQSAAIVSDMITPGQGRGEAASKVAVIFESGAYGDALGTRFVSEFQTAGGTAVQFPFSTPSQRTEQVTAAGIDPSVDEVLFISSQFTDAVAFLDSAATLPGYTSKRVFLTDAAANVDVLQTANPALFDSVRGSRPAPLNSKTDLVYANYLSSYAAAFGGGDATEFSFVANAYDAAWLVAYGVVWSLAQESEISGTTIARGLRKLSSGEAVEILPSTWTTVQNRFEEGMSIDIRGASGSLDFDPLTEETTGDFQIWQIVQKEIEGIYSIAP